MTLRRHEFQSGRRLRQIGGFAIFRNLDLAMHTLFALLHDRKIQHAARNKIVGEIQRHDKLVVILVESRLHVTSRTPSVTVVCSIL